MPGWVTDVAPKMVISSSQYGNQIRDRVVHQFNSVSERNATAVPKLGMICYCLAERTYYTWQEPFEWWNAGAPAIGPLWCVLDTGWVPWGAVLHVGASSTWAPTTMAAGYRRTLGQCHIEVQMTGVTIATVAANSLLYIQPPVAPPSGTKGLFGVASALDNTLGTFGPHGWYDDTHLAVGLLHLEGHGTGFDARLLVSNDLSSSGTFDFHMSGAYPTVLN